MNTYAKPCIGVINFTLSDRVMADECQGTFYPGTGGEYRYRIDGPSLAEFQSRNPDCVMSILDGLNASG